MQANIDRALEALHRGQWTDAQAAAQALLCGQPDHPLATLILGVAQHAQGNAQALATLARAVDLAPHDGQSHYNYAVALGESGQGELAMVEYRACLDCAPDHCDALWNYGEMLRLRDHFARALGCFERLLAIEGNPRPKMRHRMAVCCAHLQGRQARAQELFQAQIAEDDDPLTHWEYALFLLGQGREREAWPHWARRFDAGALISLHKFTLGLPEWDGRIAAGRLVIFCEQGAGDEILFAGYLPLLMALARPAALQIVLACQNSLVRLFQASFPDVRVIARDGLPQALAPCAGPRWQISLGDLPARLMSARTQACLEPDAADLQLMREVIGQRARPGALRIGLVWAANPAVAQANRRARNVPPQLAAQVLGGIAGVQLFCLQPPEHRAGLAAFADADIVDLGGWLSDFSRTAAAMCQLHAVVSVCTSTANLAAAMGLDTRVLLQQHGDWRWREASPVYETARAYRQHRYGDWSAPLEQLARDLQELAAQSLVSTHLDHSMEAIA